MARLRLTIVLAFVTVVVSCGDGDDIDTDTEARWAYLGFDRAVDRAINLGFDGFNAASSANIPPQEEDGDVSGTIEVSGQVDQGESDNKEMRLDLTLVEYADDVFDDPMTEDVIEELQVVYDTDENDLPSLELSLRNVPDGTFTGTMSGVFLLSGDLDAEATFALTLAGGLQGTADEVVREPGTLSITGTVTSADGTYDVDVLQ